jgi:hypothetical protein
VDLVGFVREGVFEDNTIDEVLCASVGKYATQLYVELMTSWEDCERKLVGTTSHDPQVRMNICTCEVHEFDLCVTAGYSMCSSPFEGAPGNFRVLELQPNSGGAYCRCLL